MIKKTDYRKYRKTKMFFRDKGLLVDALLDTGAKNSYLSYDIALSLGLPNLGDIDVKHSNNIIEKSWYTTIGINIRGKEFLMNVIISKDIGKNFLIIGADFMKQYDMVLNFDVVKNDITLKKYDQKISWDRDL